LAKKQKNNISLLIQVGLIIDRTKEINIITENIKKYKHQETNMKILMKKMSSFTLIKVKFIIELLLAAGAMIAIPAVILSTDITLITNPLGLGIIIGSLLFFGLTSYFGCIRPYKLYQKLPEALVETDGEFLYIHSRKEEKIPLSALEGSIVHVELPHMFRNAFVGELLIHLLSQRYGNITLDIPEYGEYTIYFVENVMETADDFKRYAANELDKYC
jgi:hypothetical protein